MSMILGLFVCASLIIGSSAECPDYATGLLNAAWSESMGCIWADAEESHNYDNYDQALARCR